MTATVSQGPILLVKRASNTGALIRSPAAAAWPAGRPTMPQRKSPTRFTAWRCIAEVCTMLGYAAYPA